MTKAAKKSGARNYRLRQAIYLLAIIGIAAFLWQLGWAPWLHAAKHWTTMLILAGLSAFGLVVQTMAFRLMAPPENRPGFTITLAIWAISAAFSAVAPFMAGIAARTTLLASNGMSLKDCGLASLRQMWLGLEYALLLSALALPFSDWNIALTAGGGCAMAWLTMLALRVKAGAYFVNSSPGRFRSLIQAFSSPAPLVAHSWFVLQVLTMSAVYLTGFNGFGAQMSLAQAIGLSGLTVILSLIAFVPNGLGITDAAWILFARHAGITLEEAVAIAITIRLSHLLAATVLATLFIKQLHPNTKA